MTTAENAVRFGPFEFNSKRQELTRSGFRVRLSASQLRLLTLFLDRPGELITRDQIINRIWSDTGTIDTSTGINTAINRLRTHLGDDPANPTYIETVIGLGYRFIAPLTPIVAEPPAPATQPTPDELFTPEAGIFDSATLLNLQSDPFLTASIPRRASAAKRRLRRRILWYVLASLALLSLLAIGLARYLAAHPDTTGRMVPVTFNRDNNLVTSVAVSPSGDGVAYADNAGISVHWFNARPERLLAPIPDFTVTHLAWFPNGNELLVSGLNRLTQRPQVWLVPVMGAYVRPILQEAALATVSPDAKNIAFASADNTELWLSAPDGQHAHKVFSLDTLQPGLSAAFLLWSPDSQRLILSAHSANPTPSATWIYASIHAASGNLLARQDNLRIDSAFLTPTGVLSYVTGDPIPAPSARNMFSVPTDTSTGRILSPPTVIRDLGGRRGSSISASLDGKRIAVLLDRANADVFVATLQPPTASTPPTLTESRRLTFDTYDAYPHAWTPDNTILYETELPSRPLAIYRQSLSAAPPSLVAELPQDAAMAQLSPDGRFVLFLEFSGHPSHATGVFRVPITGGTPTQVPTSGPIEEFHCPHIPSASCVLREAIDGEQLIYYALDPITGIGPALARTEWQPNRLGDWGLSPDGTIVSIADHDTLHPAVHLIPLGPNSSLRPNQPRDIPISGHGLVLGANWTSTGDALFLQTRTPTANELLYHDLSGPTPGRDTLLRSSPLLIWAVASPDGHQIAFPAQTTNTNVWTYSTP